MAALVIGAIIAVVVIAAYVVNRRMGPDPDLKGPWFPASHWRVEPRYRSPFDDEPGDWRS